MSKNSYQWNIKIKELRDNLNKELLQVVKPQRDKIVADSANIFAKYSNENLPPAKNDEIIPKELYTRPIIRLTKKGIQQRETTKFKALDEAMRKKKFKWRVGSIKKRIKYFKSAKEKTEYSKIKNRGLVRVAWSMNIEKIQGRVPKNVKKLMNKSKNLLTLKKLNNYKKQFELNISTIWISTNVYAKNILQMARKNAEFKTNKYISERLRKNKNVKKRV